MVALAVSTFCLMPLMITVVLFPALVGGMDILVSVSFSTCWIVLPFDPTISPASELLMLISTFIQSLGVGKRAACCELDGDDLGGVDGDGLVASLLIVRLMSWFAIFLTICSAMMLAPCFDRWIPSPTRSLCSSEVGGWLSH